MAAQLPVGLAQPLPTTDHPEWRGLVQAPIVMIQFLPKPEGGDGLPLDLQDTDQLKGAKNGILEKIRFLSRHELSAAALTNEAKELELFGYRCAVLGSLVYYLVPQKMKVGKTSQEWQDLAIQMRDQSVALAAASKNQDAGAVMKASARLRSACSRCHNTF
jgi:hypothetical protein